MWTKITNKETLMALLPQTHIVRFFTDSDEPIEFFNNDQEGKTDFLVATNQPDWNSLDLTLIPNWTGYVTSGGFLIEMGNLHKDYNDMIEENCWWKE